MKQLRIKFFLLTHKLSPFYNIWIEYSRIHIFTNGFYLRYKGFVTYVYVFLCVRLFVCVPINVWMEVVKRNSLYIHLEKENKITCLGPEHFRESLVLC